MDYNYNIIQKKKTNNLFRLFDYKTFLMCLMLIFIGLLSIYSATIMADPTASLFYRQLTFALIGLFVLLLVAEMPNYYLKDIAILFYLSTIMLLVLVLPFGSEVYGTKGWIRLGSWSLQPAEFAKISMLLMFAKHISKKGNNVSNIWDLSIILGYFLPPFILINLQPDFGTALVLFVVLIGILFWGGFDAFYILAFIFCGFMFIASLSSLHAAIIVGIVSLISLLFFKKKKIVNLFTIAIITAVAFVSPILYNSLAVHQKARIDIFLNPGSDVLGAGYNVIQSLLAVGSGGIYGKGYLEGTLTQLRYIPMQWTDFIYSVPAEEFGLIGSVIVLILLLSLVYRGVNIASVSRKYDVFNSIMAFGISTFLLFHIVVNVGMVLGVMPVMGIPLPFLSYGGTSLLTNLICVGILININMNNKKQQMNQKPQL